MDDMTTRALGFIRPSRGGFLLLGAIVAGVAVATYAIAQSVAGGEARSASVPVAHRSHAPARATSDAPPTAAQFASLFTTLGNLYGEQHGKAQRLTGGDCVQASPGHYMCSYAVVRPGRGRECHLMQAEWTPNAASTYRVTLAGRVTRCGTLREALASLK
jgi:hypothetical protein